MKKSLLVLTAALSFGAAAAQTAATASAPQVPALTDVPAGHWAKDAIDLLVSKGILLGYPDGTFRGTQNLTRYEAAVIIARLLGQIKTGEVTTTTMDEETLTALQNAIQELAADLAALGVRVSDLEENAVSRDDFARLEERVEMLAAASGDAEALAGLTSQIDDLTARADDYDTLRADVDDNASQIAALNDLTVLLNQDILNLQDRVSAVEAAQADLVARADFDALGGRVTTVETKVTSLDNRVAQLEKYAFSIKPSLSATYYVARANRNMDLDRLIPGTVFSTGTDDNDDTTDTAVDWADLTGGDVAIRPALPAGVALPEPSAAGFYGFSNVTYVKDADGYILDTNGTRIVNPDGTAILDANGKSVGVAPAVAAGGAVYREGETKVSFSIDFNTTAGKFDKATSGVRGAYVPGPGGLNVNSVDVTFGIRAGLPSSDYISGGAYANYPDVIDTDSGVTYRPLFFYFSNATTKFTVGNTPVTVTFGKKLKFKFADYIGDNDKTGRGDGYIVDVDGSNLPLIGSLKPTLQGVYGSKGGANLDGLYYRGIRATITPVGTLKAGVHVLQEGADSFGTQVGTRPGDVTAFGADLHGTVAGWQLDSEYATSRIAPSRLTGAAANDVETQSAFYAKTSGTLGPVKVYTLNYRTVSAGYDKVAGIMEANPKDTDNGSTAPYAANQTGFGVKVGTTVGPVSLAGYWDNKVAYGKSPLDTAKEASGVVDRGVTAKLNVFNLVTVRGGYYEYLSNPLAKAGVRYNVRGDVTPGLGLSIGAFYRDLTINGVRAADDGQLFAKGKYNSYFDLATNDLKDQTGCGDQHPGLGDQDTDGVGGALTFSLGDLKDKTCYSEYGVEVAHNGSDANALVKNLDLRLGYSARYSTATKSYSNNYVYGEALYNTKLGIANVNLHGAFITDNYAAADTTADNGTAGAFGVKVTTDTLNTVFKPSFEGQFGYLTHSHNFTGTANDYTATAMKYLVGVKLNEFLLPNTKLAVYYAGYQATNRGYQPFNGSVDAGTDATGYYTDLNTGNRTVSQDLLYVEANYYDLSFGYGYGNLRLRESNGAVVAGAADAKGSVFKISYKVNF